MQEFNQKFQELVQRIITLIKSGRRVEAFFLLSSILFFLGYYSLDWLSPDNKLIPPEIKKFLTEWYLHSIIPGILFIGGVVLLGYAVFHFWRLLQPPFEEAVDDLPSAIKGPGAFTPADGDLFRKLGREAELKKLVGYIEDDQVPLVVLMGASGAGKTSLLRAGLTNILKNKEVQCHYWEAIPSDSVKRLLAVIRQNLGGQLIDKEIEQNRAELKSFDDLINPSSQFGRHVIILDQFEQLGNNLDNRIFELFRKVASKSKPPHLITWIVAFRREYRAIWSDFVIPENERGFFPPELSLQLFTPQQAGQVIAQLVQETNLSVEQKVVDNLIKAATSEGLVSPVDIGIGLMVLSELKNQQVGKTLTEDVYHFSGGSEGVLTQYIERCLDYFTEEDRKIIMNAMLVLSKTETSQRVAEGKTCKQIATEVKADNFKRFQSQLDRLTQRDIRLLEQVEALGGKEIRYRILHERLIPAIRRLSGTLVGELEETKIKFNTAFSAWKNNKARQYLLSGKFLRLVERYQNQISWGDEEIERLQFLKRSQQKRSLKILASTFLIFFLSIGFWVAYLQFKRYEAMKYLKENGYPGELFDYQHQLKRLEFKSKFNLRDVTFLNSDSLEELVISGTQSTSSMEGLVYGLSKCPNLKKLTVILYKCEIENLPLFPNNLSSLSLTLDNSNVKNLLQFPENLTELELDVDGTLIEEIPPLPNTLTKLCLSINGKTNIRSLPQLPRNLKELKLKIGDIDGYGHSEESNIKELPQLPEGLTKLSLVLGERSKIKNLPQLPENLTEFSLNLHFSHLKELPQFPENLIKLSLDIDGDLEGGLPNQPPHLTEISLKLNGYNWRNFSSWSNTLKKISIEEIFFSEIPKFPANLTELLLSGDIDYDKIPPWPSNLTKLTLYCQGSKFANLPPFPKNLKELSILGIDNDPANLPELPENLIKLSIPITDDYFPQLPANLTELELRVNSKIEEFPQLPDNLTELLIFIGGENYIKSWPKLPRNLKEFKLFIDYQRDLKELPQLPENLTTLSLQVNKTEIKNLPKFPETLISLSLKAKVGEVREISKLIPNNCKSLNLDLTVSQRVLLKSIPKSVTDLSF